MINLSPLLYLLLFKATFGSGVVQTFNGLTFYVHSNCPFTLIQFTHNHVECDIIIRRGDSGLIVQVEITINKVRTVLQNGHILVGTNRCGKGYCFWFSFVSVPYDHMYQHIFAYGIYNRLKSLLLPLSVTWHSVPGGIDTLWVELEQELSTDMIGLCGKHNICRLLFSYTLDCFQALTPHYIHLCESNIYGYEQVKSIGCAFFKEVAQYCGNTSYIWNVWRTVSNCEQPSCAGDLVYVEQGAAFVPSCSNPNIQFFNQDLTSSCVCPNGKVFNDHVEDSRCVTVSSCPCVFAGRTYEPGDIRSTKCQSCICDSGKWQCSENICPSKCVIEGQFVSTFDGKRYVLPGKCTYVASQRAAVCILLCRLKPVSIICSLLEHVLVFWQSSMNVQVHTSFGMTIQVQVSPELQLSITPPTNHSSMISGLCGNSNGDTTDDFTTSSGIVENSAQPFAQSWSVGVCTADIPPHCISTDNEIFADEKCSVLNNQTGVFAECHGHIPTDHYYTACIQRTCKCSSHLQQCLCVALASYAKACAGVGIDIGDWRKDTHCTVECQRNLQFSYSVLACNHTCRSLSGLDPRCGLDDSPVEGCGCPEGTHLNQGLTCSPKAECSCYYHSGTTPPGPVVIDGRQCICADGELKCSEDCGCTNGKVCVHCLEFPVNTAQKTCDSLSKPLGSSVTCESGCYCPYGQYEDHHGNCVSVDNCTCVYSGKVFSAGQSVKTNCKTCTCGQGQWHCKDEPCPGKCQVYGNGHYQTFDSKWYRFDGHCQYTLVEDDCGIRDGSFSVRVESVPCCDEALTCSRSVVLDLKVNDCFCASTVDSNHS
uniref:VWFD domain-containing protein n=1 Tax=Sphaeramia orbicularis TaxID=375764 RepID=A0A673BKS7_9TELE